MMTTIALAQHEVLAFFLITWFSFSLSHALLPQEIIPQETA
jgi:hypothetical protein